MCTMVVVRESSNIVSLFENMVSRVDIACIEPCSTTFLYPYSKLYRTFLVKLREEVTQREGWNNGQRSVKD
jgi:hypothetical protein